MCLCYDEGLWCKCREERATLWSQFFCLAPFLWVPGIQLRSPSLHSKGIYLTSSLSVPELFIFGKSENTMGSSEIPSQNLENSWRNRQDRKQRLRKLRLLRVPATVQLLHGCCAQALPRLSPRSCPDGSHAPFHPIKPQHEAAWGWWYVAVVPTLGRSRHCEFQVCPVSKQTNKIYRMLWCLLTQPLFSSWTLTVYSHHNNQGGLLTS